jgi:hypothetical protein
MPDDVTFSIVCIALQDDKRREQEVAKATCLNGLHHTVLE